MALATYLRANDIEPTRRRASSTRPGVREHISARSSIRSESSVPLTPLSSGPTNNPVVLDRNDEWEECEDDPAPQQDFEEDMAGPSREDHRPGSDNDHSSQERNPAGPSETADDNVMPTIHLPNLQTAQQFIEALRTSTLDESGMEPEDIENLRNPGPVEDLVDPSPYLRSLQHFINNANSSREHYDDLRNVEMTLHPNVPFLSFDQARRRVRQLSGVIPIEHDMCPRSCIAYTGPYEHLEKCPNPKCTETRYHDNSRKPRQHFHTVPIGPVIQAFYGSRDLAEKMHYLERRLAENVEAARQGGAKLDVYDDTACGRELLDAWTSGRFTKKDIALQFSIDGAQLRPDKPSEAWVFIWVIHNLPPDLCYKKVFVIPGAIVLGPNKPGDLDSFLFPSLQHVTALQLEGLKVYDAHLNTVIPRAVPMVVFATADSPGNASMSGMVGHSGKYGCRLFCEMPGRRRKGDSHYYPASNVPDGYSVRGCCHPDITTDDLHQYRSDLPRKYNESLNLLLGSRTLTEYRARRLGVGLCKQTLFSGLPNQPLPVPSLFVMDIMHLSVLNDPDLFMKLFTGKLDCYDPDDRSTWDWAIFYQNPGLWDTHGETVARAVPYIPSSFGRVPRDPAKKINSGYKAWEFQQYIYGLGPTLFRQLLPRKYWLNFCKLVAGIRLLQRHRIGHSELLKGHALLQDFAREYEELYYQRKESRIHFVRHSIHLLSHIAPETLCAGPLACYAQWTLETAIGNLGREIRQDRDLFANLSQRAILRAQVNSLQARYSGVRIELRAKTASSLSSNAYVFEEAPGYTFLPCCEEFPTALSDEELDTLMIYWQREGWPNRESWPNAVCRWAKLCLPNGQRARSVWQESGSHIKLRRTSCVELVLDGRMRIGDILFYFYLRFGDVRYPLAFARLFSTPDAEIMKDSSDTVYLCEPLEGPGSLAVVPVTAINSVVSMFPETEITPEGHITNTGKYSLMRHAYIDLSSYASDGLFDEDFDAL